MDHLNDMTETAKLAPIKIRVQAAFIDGIIYFGLGYAIAAAFGMTMKGEEGFGFNLTGFPALLLLLVWILLTLVNEGLTGQTIGKRFMKIKVVKQDFSPTDLITSVIRHLMDIIDIIFFIGLIIASTNSNKQRIGDLVAKTFVVMK